jgi:hypothetical protein
MITIIYSVFSLGIGNFFAILSTHVVKVHENISEKDQVFAIVIYINKIIEVNLYNYIGITSSNINFNYS